ncbi:MAG: hypothetical protein JWL70_656, partial [Acidimicrobiia bacterium]|nr:hypothetical protein [Acidimicrobiia bacterium]
MIENGELVLEHPSMNIDNTVPALLAWCREHYGGHELLVRPEDR